MKIDTMFNLIETAQDKLETSITPADFIIIRDALIEANKMRIALERISKIHDSRLHPLHSLYNATELASKALKLIEY